MNAKISEGITVSVEDVRLEENGYRVQVRAHAKFTNWNVRYNHLGSPRGEVLFTLDLPSAGQRSRKHHKSIEDLESESKTQVLQFCEEIVKHLKPLVSG